MAGVIGALQPPQRLPDRQLPVQGELGSRTIFFLRAAPLPFTVVTAGASNQDHAVQAAIAHAPLQHSLGSRLIKSVFQLADVEFLDATIAGTSTVSSVFVRTIGEAATIDGTGAVAANFVLANASLASAVAGSGSISAELTLTTDPPAPPPGGFEAEQGEPFQRRRWKEW